MPDIFHDFIIKAPLARVFEGFTSPQGLDSWWTKKSLGTARVGETYELGFGPGYDWRAIVSKCVAAEEFELQFTDAHPDWLGTRVGFHIEVEKGVTHVRFYHTGWPEWNEHYRFSSYCWAMYLRILKRYIETGEEVRYEIRLDV